MEKAYLSESEMAAMKDRRFYCLSFKPLKPGGCFTYRQVQHHFFAPLTFGIPLFCVPFNSFIWRYSIQRVTEVGRDIWELLVSVHARPYAQYVCHCAASYETRFYCTTVCEKLLYRIL